ASGSANKPAGLRDHPFRETRLSPPGKAGFPFQESIIRFVEPAFVAYDSTMKTTRIERDSMGEMEVPAAALYGASTARAVNNFPISGTPLPAELIHAYGLIKRAAAETHL